MAKIKVLGDAFVVTSSLKTADIEKLSKFNKSALTIKDKESKEPVFKIAVSGSASLDKNGASFNGTNDGGYAIATIAIPNGMTKDKKKEYISENYAPALNALTAAEKEIDKSYTALKKDFETAEAAISFVEEA